MTGKAKPKGNRKPSIDLPARETGSQQVSKPGSSPGTIQAVVRVVEEFHFVSFLSRLWSPDHRQQTRPAKHAPSVDGMLGVRSGLTVSASAAWH
jgi:hypothetical protein